jgi:hypothetical protein
MLDFRRSYVSVLAAKYGLLASGSQDNKRRVDDKQRRSSYVSLWPPQASPRGRHSHFKEFRLAAISAMDA